MRNFVFLTRCIRNLRGGSQPILAEASDGNVYVCKFSDNLQGPNLLFNEAAGTELYFALGLPVAPWRPLWVSEEFVDRNPACWVQTPEGSHRRNSSLCFGTRYLGNSRQALYEILPGSYFQRIQNEADFWLAWLIDACAHHTDNRQALFLERESRELDAVFIDFGYMFGGPCGLEAPPFRASRYRDGRIYRQPKANLLMTIRRTADNLDNRNLWRKLATIPDGWKSQSASAALSACLNRLADAGYVRECLDVIVESTHTCSHERLDPGYAKFPPLSVLPSGLQTREQIYGVVA